MVFIYLVISNIFWNAAIILKENMVKTPVLLRYLQGLTTYWNHRSSWKWLNQSVSSCFR
jgi:hypothetical protein